VQPLFPLLCNFASERKEPMNNVCLICNISFEGYRRNDKYCSPECRNKARAQRAITRYHRKKHNRDFNACNSCGVEIPKAKRFCRECKSTACIACGTKRYYIKQKHSRNLCRICYNKYRQYDELVTLMERYNNQFAIYEKMFPAQQDMIKENEEMIKELKSENNRLKRYIDSLQKQNQVDAPLSFKRNSATILHLRKVNNFD
jgi:hypothetical protein